MQGYCQTAHFIIPPDPLTHDEDMLVEYAIISRRSKHRAGLRYQRRGIDEDANVANFVETETIMRVEVGMTFHARRRLKDENIEIAIRCGEYICLCPDSGIEFVLSFDQKALVSC
jgi:hypothetical protein